MITIVIVHGAWMDISGWDHVIPQLKKDGYDVIGVNLPGHGKDNTSYANISMQSYIDVVKKAIGGKKDVILIGHSMAGLVISEVAEQIPGQIKKLIYFNAYLPADGESLLTIANTDGESHIPKYLAIDEKKGTASIATNGIVDVFAADASEPDAEKLVTNMKPDALVPLATPVTLTRGNFGSVIKTYIFTLNDHTIGYALQQKMVKASTNVRMTYTLPTSHTPFLAMPGVCVAIIEHESR